MGRAKFRGEEKEEGRAARRSRHAAARASSFVLRARRILSSDTTAPECSSEPGNLEPARRAPERDVVHRRPVSPAAPSGTFEPQLRLYPRLYPGPHSRLHPLQPRPHPRLHPLYARVRLWPPYLRLRLRQHLSLLLRLWPRVWQARQSRVCCWCRARLAGKGFATSSIGASCPACWCSCSAWWAASACRPSDGDPGTGASQGEAPPPAAATRGPGDAPVRSRRTRRLRGGSSSRRPQAPYVEGGGSP